MHLEIGSPLIKPIITFTEEEERGPNILVFPNPTETIITFQMEQAFQQMQIQLLSINGNIMKTKAFDGRQKSLSIKDLPKGLYFFKIRKESALIDTGKIVVP